MCLLFLTSAALRSDSLYKADVSDFFGMSPPKKDGDVHQPWILINQIAEGKTSHGKMQYGRAIRHKDVKQCAVGGIAMYMMNREDITGEFGSMSLEDWCDNSKWFNKKFLDDVKGSDYESEMVSDSYADHVKAILLRLGLPTNKLRHLGRGCGTKMLDFEEVSEDLIRRMGQWNQSVYDQSYSSKLPMEAMRCLAGFGGYKKSYFNTRTCIKPSIELQKMTAIGKWCFDMRDQVEGKEDEIKPTALACLNWFCMLVEVFLQDVAAMFALHPEREDCALTRQMPLLQTPEFKVRLQGNWYVLLEQPLTTTIP